MADFGLELVGDRSVVLRLESFSKVVHDQMLGALQEIEEMLAAAVLADEPELTGALRGETGGRVYDHDTRIAAVVGVRAPDGNDAEKAAALEYGSHKAEWVKAHAAKLAHLWSHAIPPIMVEIPAHTRVPDISARAFLRGPIEDIHDEAISLMQAALDAAVGAAK